MRTKLIIALMLFIGLGYNADAADKPRREMQGDKYFFVYSFDKAIKSYTGTKNLTSEGQRRLAESYQNLNRHLEAEEAYAKLVEGSEGVTPEDYFTYAMVLRSNGKYDQSGVWMEKLHTAKPNDLRARDYMANKDNLPALVKGDGIFKVTGLNMNTAATDFGPAYYKDKVVFASSGTKPRIRVYNFTGQPFLNMYVANVVDGQLTDISLFNRDMKGKMHDGPAAFSTDGNSMAFTRNNYDLGRKDRVVNLHIFFSTFADGKWSEPVPFSLNNDAYSVGHPCFANNGNTMYFVSDMPGGFGGADIYRMEKGANSTWGTPVNLGDGINTEGDEMFPFMEDEKGMLFFASNGRFGLGGLDIFRAKLSGNGFGEVSNVGAPLNTTHDDFAMILNDSTKKGYVSSNRPTGSGQDDIYTVAYTDLITEKYIAGIAMDEQGAPISQTAVVLADDQGMVIDRSTTLADGAYIFKVDPDNSFKLTGNRPTYLEAETLANTFVKEDTVYANLTLIQEPVKVAEEVVEEETPIAVGDDLGKKLKLSNIYFDLDKFNIRPDAVSELDKIVKVMNDNPNMVVELSAYTDCRASKAYNMELSSKRAAVTVWYIKSRISGTDRVHGKGFGETNLTEGCACEGIVVSSCSDDQFQRDRRTEFIVMSN